MSLFGDLKTTNDIEEEKDSIGRVAWATGAYDFTIGLAYADTSTGGAKSVNLRLVTEDGRELRITEYVTSGTAKGGTNYYTNKDGKKRYLPGFEKMNQVCLLAAGKDLTEMDTEEKVITIWNPELSKEAPSKRQVLTDLLGKEITLGLIKVLEDQYRDPTKERSTVEINKVFRTKDGMTVAEIKAQEPDASFITQWKEKYTSEYVSDKREKSKGGSAPKGAITPKPTTSLFS